jgi:hypothetical protein
MDLLQRPRAYRYAIKFSIMANNGLLIAGAADIKFKAVRAMFERKIKSRDGVFRSVEPGAAMTEQ